ncbi:unnamed protein product [Cylicocyclus nassatus]|uniref:Insulin-like domain-containing protein n=1 Tax=Cylicocyclus nassatus TaxID=53992 RepID=A0AA36H1R2_CYLNA|nr:unnamed protein product [Cylicocyclus nassatus]
MTSRIWCRTYSPPLLLLLLLISLPVAESSIRLCGVRLTRTLMAICRNQLCGYSQSKRSTMWEEPRLETVHSTMKRSGIATECCENRCSFSYLKTYCCNT